MLRLTGTMGSFLVSGCKVRHWVCVLSLVTSLGLFLSQAALAQPASAPGATEAPAGELAEAEQLYQQSLKLREAGKYAEAQPLAERALAIQQKILGPEHLQVARSLGGLANLYRDQGDYATAKTLAQRALTIRENVLGTDHPDVATSLSSLSILYWKQGEYATAESLQKRALAIREKVLGPENLEVANSLNVLAVLYWQQGEFSTAESLQKRTLAIREKVLGPEDTQVAYSLDNLAILYHSRGDYGIAEPLQKRALAILEKNLGPEHPEVARSLHNLGDLYALLDDYARAESLYRQALAVREKVLGPEHPDVARTLHALGEVYAQQGNYTEAELFYRRALAIQQKALRPGHPEAGYSLQHLGNLYWEQGKYSAAEALYQQALAIQQTAFGPEHPNVADALYDLTTLRLGQGRVTDARQNLSRTLQIQEYNFSLNLASGSEERNRAYLASRKEAVDLATSLHLRWAPDDPQAARLALSAALARKGRVLEEASATLVRLRRHLGVPGQKQLQQLADARSQLASLVFREPDASPVEQYQSRIAELRDLTRQLEDSLAQMGAEAGAHLRDLTRPVTLEAIQRALPRDAALVEFVLYRPFELKAARPSEHFGPPRYAAYLLQPSGPPIGVDLGKAEQIDALVSSWRAWLLDPASPADGPVGKIARVLHEKLFGALAGRLKAKHLLIAPDGQLNTVPFAALVARDGRYLLERHTLTYLVSGRELLRLKQAAPMPQTAPLVVGGPDFGRAQAGNELATRSPKLEAGYAETPTPLTDNPRSLDLAGFAVRPLPGAIVEAQAVTRLLGTARLLTGPEATENALKAARSPAVLHLATHGFFLRDKDALKAEAGAQEPLLRSGVALAGFNARSSGREDGVLTALEVQGLELEGTRLVVLSACDTGSGPVLVGEGLQGLRRSLALAGTRSQVLALWQVGDRTTARLMEQFYRGLAAGAGRSEALRRSQLELLRTTGRTHPYWWASFALSGDWRPVSFVYRSPPQSEP
ncbi:tetratricopeptide repeat protein [Gloeobacter kilaueensis]|uniref:Cellulose synthase subunit BcsC n=1 Tax=Gloeobacter kilaueensis (strain ATCC BAA-2537 / CCAP 1431/1 / ULC 316 / JS1) TaxID=1183438 RepID=U5QDZ7_GLOK1|nr:tetratricopeptide repeat protein [Gloeobacter kilaueensis]AGY57187.1 cellulose synthase subunit BcsC [Gloeobacter kilaueensis JS1]